METQAERQKWLQWRREGIGSSDAPVIMGVSEWSTPRKLCEDKLSTGEIEDSTNFIMEKGNRLEPEARKLFAAQFNMQNFTDETFEPRLVQMQAPLDYMRASLDMASKDLSVIGEIKFQGKAAHLATINGAVSEKYMPQVRHGMLVSGAQRAFFISYNPDHTEQPLAFVEVQKSAVEEEKHLLKCAEFWQCVQTKTLPDYSDGDYVPMKDRTVNAKIKRYAKLKEKADKIEADMETLKKEIFDAVKHDRMMGPNGIKIQRITSKGNIDYKKIPELKLINLEQYRGKDRISHKILVGKKAE